MIWCHASFWSPAHPTRWCQWNSTKPDICWMSETPARARRNGSVREDQGHTSNQCVCVCQARQRRDQVTLSCLVFSILDLQHLTPICLPCNAAYHSHLHSPVPPWPHTGCGVGVGCEQVQTGEPAISLMEFTAAMNLVLHTLSLIYHFYNISLWEFMAIYVITQIIQIAINGCNVL